VIVKQRKDPFCWPWFSSWGKYLIVAVIIDWFDMKKILGYIRAYITESLNIYYLITIMLLMAALIIAQYVFRFPAAWIGKHSGTWMEFWGLALLYGSVYVFAFLIQPLFGIKATWLRNPYFWGLIIFGVLVFALRSYFFYHNAFVAHIAPQGKIQLWQRIADNIVQGLITTLPLFIFWFFKHRKEQPFYGFSTKYFDAKPYFQMLLIMVPLIVLASTQPDFLRQYPKGMYIAGTEHLNKSTLSGFLGFEFFYGLDFVAVELFFRGFLILAFAELCGRHAILPMACFYVLIHFWKPAGETVSSFFGGMLLGILAYETKSIYGGIIAHLGVAWMMEAGAAIAKSL
jgi:membrane protease YdiL (CAAX protease family)